MANTRTIVTDTYKGETIECAEFNIDTTTSLFKSELLDRDGDYAFQMIAKADSAKSIQVIVGDKTHTFDLTASWEYYSFIFTDVTVNNSYLQFSFLSNGTFRLYHSKLEHGNKITDWNESNYDIESVRTIAEQTADKFTWIVQGGTSSTDFTLTNRTAVLVSDYINLNGLVAFGGINDDLRRLLQGTEKINVLANMESISITHDKLLYAYVNDANGGISESITVDFDGTPKVVPIGKVADYSLWDATKRGYLPSDTDVTIYHGYINWSIFELNNLANADFWWSSNNNEWRMILYNVTDGEVINTSTVSTAAENALVKTIIYAKSTVRKDSQALVLVDSEGIGIHRYDTNLNTFVEYNRNTYLGSRLGSLCTDNDMTIIDGGKLATGSIEADKLNVNSLEAVSANIGGFEIVDNNIECETPTDANNPSIFLKRYNEETPYTYGESSYTYPSQKHLQNGYIETGASPNHDYCMPYQHEIFRNADGEEWSCKYGDSVKPLDDITWEDYESGLTGANSTTLKYIDPNGDYRIETDASMHIRITTGGELTIAQEGYSYPGRAAREQPFPLLDIYCDEVNINNKEVWTAGNLVCGKITSTNIAGSTGSAVVVSVPTSQVGTDPIVTVTTTRIVDKAWLGGITISGDNALIHIGIFNEASSAHTITVNYMIAKNS